MHEQKITVAPRRGGKTLAVVEAERDYWKQRAVGAEHDRDILQAQLDAHKPGASLYAVRYPDGTDTLGDQTWCRQQIAQVPGATLLERRVCGYHTPWLAAAGGLVAGLGLAGGPAFLVSTDDVLSQAGAEQLRADLQIKARPTEPS